MSNRSSQDEQPKRSTTNTQTFLDTCVLDTDHKALEEYLGTNLVQQSDLDRCLLRGLQIVQRKQRVVTCGTGINCTAAVWCKMGMR